jgi:hypothetical protein
VKRVFERGEFNALFADMDAPTDDDVSITIDGRRLDSVEAVMALVEDVARDRAATRPSCRLRPKATSRRSAPSAAP